MTKSLYKRWLAYCKPFLDKILKDAREDPRVSNDAYQEMLKEYNKLYIKALN